MFYEPSSALAQRVRSLGLSIRQDKQGDLENVKNLMFDIFKEYSLQNLINWYSNHPETLIHEWQGYDENRRVAYIIENQNAIAGCGIILQEKPNVQSRAEISKVYLKPEFRGKGLGKLLVGDLIDKSKDLGYSEVFLLTRTEFVEAVNLYKQFGFVKIENPYYKSKNSIALLLST